MARHALWRWGVVWLIVSGATLARATIFATVRGIVHDSQHRPVPGVVVQLAPATGGPARTATTDAQGEFQFTLVPLGRYTLAADRAGFAPARLAIEVVSGTNPIFHLELRPAALVQQVVVTAEPGAAALAAAAPRTLVSQQQIAQTPGADRSSGLTLLTDFVPGAVAPHNQIHIRGEHNMQWAIDGVPVPNLNLANSVGPQFNPKDIDELEVMRGGSPAEYGERTAAVLNVVPRSGFQGTRFGELWLSYGNFHQSDDYLALGSHTARLGWYVSANGNRSDYGLAPPTPAVLHDAANGFGGFASLIFNARASDQLRLVAAARRDFYQVPNTPAQQADGIRDDEIEQDAFLNGSWLHTSPSGWTTTLAPLVHASRAHFRSGPLGSPVRTDEDNRALYAGGVASFSLLRGREFFSAGLTGWVAQQDTRLALSGVLGEPPTPVALSQRVQPTGSVLAGFLEDQLRPTDWLMLQGGLRLTHFSGSLEETAADPRLGLAIRLPGPVVLRATYARFYQPPPLVTVSGPLLALALEQGFGFLPLRGERDETWEAGWSLPLAGWTADFGYFHTWAANFLDHEALGNSNLFFPLTIQTARIRGWEATVHSPRLLGRLQWRLNFVNQQAQGRGAVTGGLTDFAPPEALFFYLDHDQRNTLTSLVHLDLPARLWVAAAMQYGSGFLAGDGPNHLGGHTTFDLALGGALGERWAVVVTALNVADRRFLLDTANSFGGTHFNDPRQLTIALRYRFHF